MRVWVKFCKCQSKFIQKTKKIVKKGKKISKKFLKFGGGSYIINEVTNTVAVKPRGYFLYPRQRNAEIRISLKNS